jgi:nitrate reductase gamma subunit
MGDRKITLILLLLAVTLTTASVSQAWAQHELPDYAVPERNFHGASKKFIDATGKTCTDCHNSSYYLGGDFFNAESSQKMQFNWIFFAIAVFIFLSGMFSKISIWARGKRPSMHQVPRYDLMLKGLWNDVFLEKKVWTQGRLRWFIYFNISMGFVLLFITVLVTYLTRLWIPIDFFISGAGSYVLDFLADLFGLMVLVGTLTALYRRYFMKPEFLNSTFEDYGILLFLLVIVLTGFIEEGLRLAVLPSSGALATSFVGFLFALPFRTISEPVILGIHYYLWMLHALIAFAFIAWMPFTKIVHFLACPVTILITVSEDSIYPERNRYRQPQQSGDTATVGHSRIND